MAIETPSENTMSDNAERKRLAKRRRGLLRRFTDPFENAPATITPRWQRAIDNYKRVREMESSQSVDAYQSANQ